MELAEKAPKRIKNRRSSAIKPYLPVIRKLQSKGYTHDKLWEFFNNNDPNFPLKESTFRAALVKYAPTKKK